MTSQATDQFQIGPNDLILSPAGNDAWSGRLAEHDEATNDGPLCSIRKALYTIRNLRHRGQVSDRPTLWLRGGTYPLDFPVEFKPFNSHIRLCAWPGEEPVLDGGVSVNGWQPCEVNGKNALKADVKGLLLEHGTINSLFVNGHGRPRSRMPENGYFYVDRVPDQKELKKHASGDIELLKGNMRVQAADGDLNGITNWEGAEMVLLNRWIIERLPIASYEKQTHMVNFKDKTRLCIRSEFRDEGPKTNRYYIENVKEGLLAPGNWYLDKAEGVIYYLPMDGEQADTIRAVVPITYQLVRMAGDLDNNEPVKNVRLEGLTLRHCDWCHPDNSSIWWDPYDQSAPKRYRSSFRHFIEVNSIDPQRQVGSVPQGAQNLPGAVHVECAENCSIENCTIENVGFHAVDIRQGCTHIRVVGNEMRGLGGGGVNIDGADLYEDTSKATGWIVVSDNRISSTGWVFPAACGILNTYAFKVVMMHNEIFDTTYSGISCGWVWGFGESPSYGHRIEKNHIYNIGNRGDLSDMGGIYTLGFQPGTFIRCNLIHDVSMSAYGGWGLYTDEGSSGLTIENNIISNTATEAAHEHMSRSNLWRNNIFAFSRLGGVNFNCAINNPIIGRGIWFDFPPEGRTFTNNIVVTKDKPIFRDGYDKHEKMGSTLRADLNLYWDYDKGANAVIHHVVPPHVTEKKRTLKEYQVFGWDQHSMVADPLFKDPENGDFTLSKDSPAFQIGFVPIDLSDVGPRPQDKRGLPF